VGIKIINKIKKNLAIINIMIFFVVALFFYLNKNKFDTYRTYIEYSFHERLILTNPADSYFFSVNKIKYFLNDLDFNKKLYGIVNHRKRGGAIGARSGIKNSLNEITIKINYNSNKIEFEFDTKKKQKFISTFISNIDEEVVMNENEEIINNFIEKSLNKFHIKLFTNLKSEIKNREKQVNQLIRLQSNLLDTRVVEIMASEYELEQKKILTDHLKGQDLINMNILEKQNAIAELSNLELNNKLIIINDYSKKFRRLHLNSDEYVISFLILILLFNFLIKNFEKILK